MNNNTPEIRLWTGILLNFLKDIQRDNRMCKEEILQIKIRQHKHTIESTWIAMVCHYANTDIRKFKKTAHQFINGRRNKAFENKPQEFIQ